MKKRIKYSLMFLLIIVLLICNKVPVTYARYVSAFNEKINIVIREPQYTIKFNSNTGSGIMNDQIFAYNKAENLTDNEFKKYGFDFMGWNTAANGSGTFFDDEEEINNLTTEDGKEYTLYAQWQNVVNIRIEDVGVASTSNATASNIDFDYETPTLSNLASTVSLTNQNAYVTFDIDITNYLNKQMGIYSITGLPTNLDYEIVSNYNIKDKLCDGSPDNSGEDCNVQLRIKYKNGGYSSGNTTYNLDLDILFKKVYDITYENIYGADDPYPSDITDTIKTNNYYDNNGNSININNLSYPEYIMEDETLTIKFYPHVPNCLTISNNVTNSYTKPNLTLSNPTGNVKITNTTTGDIIMYDHPTSVTFNRSNNINTNVNLLNNDNYRRDFKVEFTIDSRNNTQDNLATLFNIMDESGSPWPGIMLRIDGGHYHAEANGGANQSNQDFEYNNMSSVVIEKTNGRVYISSQDGNRKQLSDYSNYSNPINIPATFGSSIQGNNIFRPFNGALSKMKITYTDSQTCSSQPHQQEDSENERWILITNPNDIVAGGTYLIGYNDNNSNYMGIDDYNNITRGSIVFEEAETDDNYTYYKATGATDYYRWKFDTNYEGGKIQNASNNQYLYFNNGTLTLSPTNRTITTMDWNSAGYWLIHGFINGQEYYLKYNNGGNNKFSAAPGDDNRNMKIYRLVDVPTDAWQKVFEWREVYSFTGSNNLETGVYLFNTENYNKDFEVTFKIDNLGNNTGAMETLFNSMDESGSNSYPGVAFRIQNNDQTNNVLSYFITADMDAAIDVYPISQANIDDGIRTVKITRIDGKLQYYVNGEVISRYEYDFYDKNTPTFDTEATFGSSIQNGNIYRPFTGDLSNMVIRLRDRE